MDEKKVKGKILLCLDTSNIIGAYEVGAIGFIGKQGRSEPNISSVVPYAITILSEDQFRMAESYYKSTK